LILWEQDEKIAKPRQTLWTSDRSIFIVEQRSPNRMAALAAGPETIRSRWLAEVGPAIESSGVRIALVDAEGRSVIGEIHPLSDANSARPMSATGLPWTLYAESLVRVTAIPAFAALAKATSI
jgi:hypothetical protein